MSTSESCSQCSTSPDSPSIKFQPYFERGFPDRHDHRTSAAATWGVDGDFDGGEVRSEQERLQIRIPDLGQLKHKSRNRAVTFQFARLDEFLRIAAQAVDVGGAAVGIEQPA